MKLLKLKTRADLVSARFNTLDSEKISIFVLLCLNAPVLTGIRNTLKYTVEDFLWVVAIGSS